MGHQIGLSDALLARVSGRLSYSVWRRGKLIEQVDDQNLIVVGSQATHAHLLGGDVSGNSVTRMGFGTNGTAPVFANASLTSAYTNSLAAPTYPASNQVSFGFSLQSTESGAYGMAISEFGLLTTSGVLYARKVRSAPLNFSSDISLSGSWVISF